MAKKRVSPGGEAERTHDADDPRTKPIIAVKPSNGLCYRSQRMRIGWEKCSDEKAPIATEILGKKLERGIIPLFIRMGEIQVVS